jgi:hypothetical protein
MYSYICATDPPAQALKQGTACVWSDLLKEKVKATYVRKYYCCLTCVFLYIGVWI